MLYVEGGGHRAALQSELRKGFRELMIKANFTGRLPRVIACGPRDRAYRRFRTALREGGGYPILLVDSEVMVRTRHQPPNPSGAWAHLASSDGWKRPVEASDDQAQLMATCMETWLIADRRALHSYFPGLNQDRLPPIEGLEGRPTEDVIEALKRATVSSGRGKYDKGRHSFPVLGLVDPSRLELRLPHFRRFMETLDARLKSPLRPPS